MPRWTIDRSRCHNRRAHRCAPAGDTACMRLPVRKPNGQTAPGRCCRRTPCTGVAAADCGDGCVWRRWNRRARAEACYPLVRDHHRRRVPDVQIVARPTAPGGRQRRPVADAPLPIADRSNFVDLHAADRDSLDPDEALTGKVLDAYLAALVRALPVPPYLSVADTVYSYLAQGDPQQYPPYFVEWTRRMFHWDGSVGHRAPGGVVVLPCGGASDSVGHWILLVIVVRPQAPHLVLCANSLSEGGRRRGTTSRCHLPRGVPRFLEYALQRGGPRRSRGPLYEMRDIHSPHQVVARNNNCGVFLLRNTEWILRTAPPAPWAGQPPDAWLDLAARMPAAAPVAEQREKLWEFVQGLRNSRADVMRYVGRFQPFLVRPDLTVCIRRLAEGTRSAM